VHTRAARRISRGGGDVVEGVPVEKSLEQVIRELYVEVQSLRAQVASPLPVVLTRKRAAEELSISESKLKGMIRNGDIRACSVGGKPGIPSAEVRRIAATAKAPVLTSASEGRRRRGAKEVGGRLDKTRVLAAIRKKHGR
jgi:hypothetical protein